MLIKLPLWVRLLFSRPPLLLSFLTASVSMVNTKQWLFSSAHIHPHLSVFFLLFLQLLHGALVREHWGDGCKYLIVGDFLGAGRVPHFRREVGNTNTNTSVFSTHHVLIKIHKRFMQYVVWVFCNSGDFPPDAQGQSALTFMENVLKENQENYSMIFLLAHHLFLGRGEQ